MRNPIWLLLLLSLGAPLQALAQESAPLPAAAALLDTVVVTGEQPGPGLWKVSRGEHVLWVFGTLSPLPRRMQWNADEVEAALAGSQEFIGAPGASFHSDLGFFGQLALLPSLIGARENPGHVHLDAVLPPELYARWRSRKAEYMGRNPKVERWRPIFAAMALYEAALKKRGLDPDPEIGERLTKLAKKAGVPVTEADYRFEIADPKAALKEFKRMALDDQDCLARTLDRIDGDLGAMAAAANAWATGDLDALRSVPLGRSQWQACRDALADTTLLRSRGITDVEARVREAWLTAAGDALERNASSFAIAPIGRLLPADGYLHALCAARDCVIEAPDAAGSAEAEPAAP
ncbi:MAG: TraB/GumN family protein [Xanthomonadales bacterium]|nr:TraB/GumN family protein [Xanthomonadales bacterium]